MRLRHRGGRRSTELAFAGLVLFVMVVACDPSTETDETKRGALTGDPIQSVQQVEGVAPVKITNSPPDGTTIDSTSFTIGLFNEDDATLCTHPTSAVGISGLPNLLYYQSPCGIMSDLDPLHRGALGNPYPAFDDVSVVEVTVNAGEATALHWDWEFNAYYQAPFGEFWAEVVDENNQTTTVIDKTSAPPPWGFRPIPGDSWVIGMPPFMSGPQQTDLDLAPWSGQQIKVRFVLHTNYDPTFFSFSVPPGFIIGTGSYDAGPSKVYVSNLRVETCAVTSVEFEEVDAPLLPNRAPGGGLRIFPDKQTPTDSTDRSLVRVVAHTNRPNCPVTMQALDVDDPSTDSGMVDSNGPAGGDNRGGCGAFADNGACTISGTSGPDATLSENFFVTRQPGDNFVIIAGADATDVGGVTSTGLTISDARGNKLPTPKLKKSSMLTVWRRLHVELDSMGIVAGNHAAGRVATIDGAGPDNIRLGLTTTPLLPLNRFENGRLVVGSVSLPVISSDLGSVLVANPGAAVLNGLGGQPFTLYDDDDFDLLDGDMPRGDEGKDVPTPDISLLQNADDPITNVLFDAYVLPIYDLGQDGAVPFVLNTPANTEAGEQSLFRFDHSDTEADATFWTVYLLGAYQHTTDRCSDPDDAANANMGRVDKINGQGAAIFIETIRDVGETATDNRATTGAHEIGHLFGLLHGEGGLMGDDDEGRTITLIAFADVSLAKIRSISHP